MLWRLLKEWLLLAAETKQRKGKYSIDSISEPQLTHGTDGIPKTILKFVLI